MNRLTGRQEQILDYIRDYLAETGFPLLALRSRRKWDSEARTPLKSIYARWRAKAPLKCCPAPQEVSAYPFRNSWGFLSSARLPPAVQFWLRNLLQTTATFPLTCSPPGRLSSCGQGHEHDRRRIYEDDLLAVHKTDQARSGDIVVARVDDEVTVKRLETSRSKHKVTLIAENPDFDPIVVDLRDRAFAIEGISVGVIRRQI